MRSSILGLLVLRLVLGLTVATIAGCAKDTPSFSLLSESNVFNQSVAVDTKIDVLFVVDNSGSMQPFQQNLVTNFHAFINNFVTKGFDFHIGVTTSDAYLVNFGSAASQAKLKDGVGVTHSGVFVIDQNTPNIENTFVTNASQGVNGDGDERVLSSFQASLSSGLNAGFHRSDAFLAVIILSDEDDFSGTRAPDTGADHNYADPGLTTVNSYVTFLDTLTGSSGASRRYSVSTIAVLDAACQASHAVAAPTTIIGQRYIQLTAATGGVTGSLCSPNYSTELDKIQSGILKLASQFYLPRVPVPSSIVVIVNGAVIPQAAVNGWTYNPATNSIMFDGTALPAQGASIVVNYDPVTIL